MEESVICVTWYVIPNAGKRASLVWNDYQTHMRVRNRWKKLKNYESNYLHPERIKTGVKKQQLSQHQICCQNIRHFSQNIRSGNTDAYHPRVYIRKVPALWRISYTSIDTVGSSNVMLVSTLAEHGNTQLLLCMVAQNTQEWRKLLQYFSNLENS